MLSTLSLPSRCWNWRFRLFLLDVCTRVSSFSDVFVTFSSRALFVTGMFPEHSTGFQFRHDFGTDVFVPALLGRLAFVSPLLIRYFVTFSPRSFFVTCMFPNMLLALLLPSWFLKLAIPSLPFLGRLRTCFSSDVSASPLSLSFLSLACSWTCYCHLQFRLYFETGVFGSTFLGRLRSGFSSSQTLLLSLSSRAFFVTVMFSLTCYWHFQFRLELKLAFSSLPCRTSSLVFLHFSDLLRHFCHGRGCHWHVSLTVHVTGTVTSVTILETGVFRLYLF